MVARESGGLDEPVRQREEFLLDGQCLRDQLGASQRTTTSVRVAAKTMPQPKELTLQCEFGAVRALPRFVRVDHRLLR